MYPVGHWEYNVSIAVVIAVLGVFTWTLGVLTWGGSLRIYLCGLGNDMGLTVVELGLLELTWGVHMGLTWS